VVSRKHRTSDSFLSQRGIKIKPTVNQKDVESAQELPMNPTLSLLSIVYMTVRAHEDLEVA
jgi:hypothetical protein